MNARNATVRLASIAVFASMGATAAAQCPPLAPTNVRASSSACDVVVSWNVVSGASGYSVYRGATWEESTWIGGSDDPEFVDALAPVGYNKYWVTAKRILCLPGWGTSAPGGPAIEWSQGTPSAPINVLATDGTVCGGVEISWGLSAQTGAVDGFLVFRNTVPLYLTSSGVGSTLETWFYDTSAQPGTTYYYWIHAVSNCGSATSTSDSGWASTNSAPSNNSCAAAAIVQSGQTYTGSTGCATSDGSSACGGSSRDVWYRFQPMANGVMRVNTCSSSALFDTVLSVHSGCPGTAANQVGCNDNACGGRSLLDVPVTAGQHYRIRVAGRNAMDSGSYQLGVSFTPTACYANCDGSTAAPQMTANDFQCFLARYSAGDPYANCDGSTWAPVLNALDFQCFLNNFAAGCP